MKTSTIIRTTRFALAAAVVLLCAAIARGSASSTNFEMIEEGSGWGGGDAFSTNFKLVAMFPEGPMGPSGSSPNFILDMELVPFDFLPDDTTPPVITAGPTVIYLSNTRALIEWTTDEITDGAVEYGTTLAYGSTTAQTGPYSTLHQVLLTGLSAGTLYNFRVRSTDPFLNGPTQSANNTFNTTVIADNIGPAFTPVVTVLGVTSARVDFDTDEAATTVFSHGPTTSYGTDIVDDTFATVHTVTLTGLPAGTTYHFAIDATDPTGNTTNGVDTVIVLPQAVDITTTLLPGGTAGSSYNASVVAIGGLGTRTFSISSGLLPPGLNLFPATGVISGTPTIAGTYTFTLAVTDSGSPASVDTQAYVVSVGQKRRGGGGGCSSSSGAPALAPLLLLMAAVLRRSRKRNS